MWKICQNGKGYIVTIITAWPLFAPYLTVKHTLALPKAQNLEEWWM